MNKKKKKNEIKEGISRILDDCQKSFGAHQKSLKAMKRLYLLNPVLFKKEFQSVLNQVLLISKREPAVERTIQFIFALSDYLKKEFHNNLPIFESSQNESSKENSSTSKSNKKTSKKKKKSSKKNEESEEMQLSDGEDSTEKDVFEFDEPIEPNEEFYVFILKYCLNLCDTKDKCVRFRSCQILAGLMSNLKEIDNALWDELESKMKDRIRDKLPIVRCQAVVALKSLQNPREKNDEVILQYIDLLDKDPSKDVRKAVLNSIGVSKYTLEHVIKRIRDENEEVRKTAFSVISKKVPFDKLSTEQRIYLLKEGFSDRSKVVQTVCQEMLCKSWTSHSSISGDPIKLLNQFDVENNEDTVVLALRALFQDTKFVIPFKLQEELDNEHAFYWRVYLTYLKTEKKEEVLEEALISLFKKVSPDEDSISEIDYFCQILEKYLDHPFITKQLLLITKCFDLAVASTSRHLSSILCKLIPLPETSEELRKLLMKTLLICYDESEYIRITLEIISEIQEPLEKEKSITAFEESKMQEKNLLITLELAEELLLSINKSISDPGLIGLLQSVILPAVKHTNSKIRIVGVKCLGLFCLLDREQAITHSMLLSQILKNDQTSIKLVALASLFDLILVFGVTTFTKDPLEEANSLSQSGIHPSSTNWLIHLLADFMDSANSEIRTTTVEGFAKLFFSDVLNSTKVLSKLLTIYFHPLTNNDNRLRQCLTLFLNSYPKFSKKHHLEMLEGAFIPTIKRCLKENSISIDSVVSVLLDILKTDGTNHFPHHEKLLISTLILILSNPSGNENKLCKSLHHFRLTKETSQDTIKSASFLLDLIIKSLEDKNSIKFIEKFKESLKLLDETPNKSLTEEEAKELISEWAQLNQDLKENKKEEEEDDYYQGFVNDGIIPVEIQKHFQKIQQFDMQGLKSSKTSNSKNRSTSPATSIGSDDEDKEEMKRKMEQLLAEKEALLKELEKYKASALPSNSMKRKSPEPNETSSSANKKRKLEELSTSIQSSKPNTVIPSIIVAKESNLPQKKTGESDPSNTKSNKRKVEEIEKEPNTATSSKKTKRLGQHLESDLVQEPPEISNLVPTNNFNHPRSPIRANNNTLSSSSRFKVAFSGFKQGDKVYHLKYREDLINRILVLGGQTVEGEQFDASVTHLITPPRCRTMKTLAASLTGKWLVTPEWVLESTSAGAFVNEENFGTKKTVSPFFKKKVFISPDFKFENRDKDFKDSNYNILIQVLGKGEIVDNRSKEFDMALVAVKEDRNRYSPNVTLLTWEQFFDLIQTQKK